jgi:SAM-dependent methyltransferase
MSSIESPASPRNELPSDAGPLAGEEELRIAAAYARREKCFIADRYSYFDPGNLMLIQAREHRVLRLLSGNGCRPLGDKRILEVGCGCGIWLRQFVQWGARPENLVGVDLLPARIAEAASLCPTAIDVRCGSAAAIDLPDDACDIVLQSTVFTSILDPAMKRQIAREMVRVLKPTGFILWYDFLFNNWRNPDVRGVGRTEIRELFSGCRVSLERITLAPPLARLLAPYSRLACLLLEKIPLLCTHYLGTIRKA